MFSAIFGKSPLRSWTAWGLAVWAAGPEVVDAAAGLGLITPVQQAAAAIFIEKAGQILAILGVRRAVTVGPATSK